MFYEIILFVKFFWIKRKKQEKQNEKQEKKEEENYFMFLMNLNQKSKSIFWLTDIDE